MHVYVEGSEIFDGSLDGSFLQFSLYITACLFSEAAVSVYPHVAEEHLTLPATLQKGAFFNHIAVEPAHSSVRLAVAIVAIGHQGKMSIDLSKTSGKFARDCGNVWNRYAFAMKSMDFSTRK